MPVDPIVSAQVAAADVQAKAAVLQTAAAFLTLGAAVAAVVAAFRGPRLAARFAEDLRREAVISDELRNTKLSILSTLMRHRGHMVHLDAVAALNMIDVAFVDAGDVREAYQQYWNAIAVPSPMELKRERFYKIIETIIRDVGLSDKIRAADIERAYYPQFVGRQVDVLIGETERKWSELYEPDGKPKFGQPAG